MNDNTTKQLHSIPSIRWAYLKQSLTEQEYQHWTVKVKAMKPLWISYFYNVISFRIEMPINENKNKYQKYRIPFPRTKANPRTELVIIPYVQASLTSLSPFSAAKRNLIITDTYHFRLFSKRLKESSDNATMTIYYRLSEDSHK